MSIESFIRYLQFEKRFSHHTVTAYLGDLEDFSEFVKRDGVEPIAAEHQDVRSWMMNLVEAGLNPRSLSRKLSTLRSFYKFLNREGIIDRNPMGQIRAPKVAKRLPAIIEVSKMDMLLDGDYFGHDFPGIRDRLVVELLYNTGIRLSEVLGLKDADINEFDSQILVLGKRNKERIIPISKALLALIQQYQDAKLSQNFCNKSEALIVTNRGEAAYPKLIYDIVKLSLSNISTQTKRSPHVLRHSFATAMLDRGADLNAIKELLGHSSLAATQVYTHNSVEKLKAVYKQAHPKA